MQKQVSNEIIDVGITHAIQQKEEQKEQQQQQQQQLSQHINVEFNTRSSLNNLKASSTTTMATKTMNKLSQSQSSTSHNVNSVGDSTNNNSNNNNENVLNPRTSIDQVTSTTSISSGSENRLRRRNFSHEPGMTRRCVCNLSQCASSNYMCKSERRILEDGRELDAGCFIEEWLDAAAGTSGSETGGSSSSSSQHGVGVTESNGRVTSARRGCIEMLSREKQEMCSDHTGAPIQCCLKDMCNYPKAYYPPFTQNVNSNRLSFDSTSGGVQGATPNLDHQVWLRAAVIAVPVCGLMILIVLILVARRILKNDDVDYKESSNSTSGMGRTNRNKTTYNNYPGPHPPHQHVKPVFLEPQEFLLPIENRCCCHNNINNSSTEYPVLVSGGYPQNPSTNSGETEELVNSIGQLSHCQCPSNLSETGSYCSSNRPPSLLQYPPPTIPHPKKFNLFSHLGLTMSRNISKETNNMLNNSRTYDV